jgi:hypothetical protein
MRCLFNRQVFRIRNAVISQPIPDISRIMYNVAIQLAAGRGLSRTGRSWEKKNRGDNDETSNG